MTYNNYCTFSSIEELEVDNARVQKNREQLLTTVLSSKEFGYAFILGNTFVVLFDGLPAWADDLEPAKQAKKETAKRISNALGCGAITLACSKAATPEVAQAAANGISKSAGNPKMIAAFMCGAAVAWCAKYAIFDK